MMKRSVCFISPHFSPKLGGVETHLKEVSAELIKKGWKVTVLTFQESEDDQLKDTIEKIEVLRIPLASQKNKLAVWRYISQSETFKSNYTIFHAHDVGWWLLPVLPLIKKKLYVTFHGWEGQYPVRWQAKLHRWLLSKVAQGTVHVGDFIKDFYWDSPTLVTYGGVRPHTISAPTIGNPLEPRIAFLGRLEPENAVETYIQLLSELTIKGIKPVMTWIGDGSLRQQCQVWGKVTGVVTQSISYLLDAEVVFANSYLSILEAQAVGKVVCSVYDHALKRAYITQFPGSEWIVHSDSASAVAEQLELLLNEPNKIKDLSRHAANFAHAQTWEKVASLYEKLWNQAL